MANVYNVDKNDIHTLCIMSIDKYVNIVYNINILVYYILEVSIMTLYDLWCVAPASHVFINNVGGEPVEYTGSGKYTYWYVADVRATSFPMYKSVLLVNIRNH